MRGPDTSSSERRRRHVDWVPPLFVAGLFAILLLSSIPAQPKAQWRVAADTTPPTVTLTSPSPG